MTYLFDIGNVLLSFDFQPALNSLMGENPAHNAFDKLMLRKDDFESGDLSADEYVLLARDILDYHGPDSHFLDVWNSIFTKIPATFELAKSLKEQGHRLILFSNISPIHANYCKENYHLMSLFDAAAFSYQMKAIKPNDKFFTKAFEKFDIIPKDTIYIDDLPENIATGKRLGLQSFRYDSGKHHDLIAWLETL